MIHVEDQLYNIYILTECDVCIINSQLKLVCIYMCTYVCIMFIITEMSHLTRIASSPDDEFDYENRNLNMGDLDPD